jgi:hypothetical protein
MATTTLTSQEVAVIISGYAEIRRAAKTMEFAQMDLEIMRKDALAFYGGDNVINGTIQNTAKPLGAIDKLLLMTARMDDILKASTGRR